MQTICRTKCRDKASELDKYRLEARQGGRQATFHSSFVRSNLRFRLQALFCTAEYNSIARSEFWGMARKASSTDHVHWTPQVECLVLKAPQDDRFFIAFQPEDNEDWTESHAFVSDNFGPKLRNANLRLSRCNHDWKRFLHLIL